MPTIAMFMSSMGLIRVKHVLDYWPDGVMKFVGNLIEDDPELLQDLTFLAKPEEVMISVQG